MAKYRFKTKPYAHQVKAVKRLLKQGYGGALLMEPRTGKTKTAIDWVSILATQKKTRKLVVICPARVMGVWIEEFHNHSPLMVNVTVWDADARKDTPLPRDDGRWDLYVVIVNFDAFSTPGRKLKSGRRSRASGRFKVRSQLEKWIGSDPCACVIDESHKIGSPSGKAANMIVSMGPLGANLFEYRAILTGTPQTKAKKAFTVWMQWNFLNPDRFHKDFPTVGEFKAEFGRWTSANGFPQWLGPKNMDELHRRIHADAFAITRQECFDMPPPVPERRYVELTGETARVYDEMAEQMVARLKNGDITEASIKIVQALRLAQITGGVAKTDEGKLVRIGRDKLRALEPILEESFDHDEKVVIAARFKPDLSAVARLGAQLDVPVWRLQGGLKREETDSAVREFRRHDGAALFVVQPQAGGLGIDLSTAGRFIWYSLTTSWVDFTQCTDRVALNRHAQYIHLLARGTVDQVLLDTLELDGDVARALTRSPESLLRTAG